MIYILWEKMCLLMIKRSKQGNNHTGYAIASLGNTKYDLLLPSLSFQHQRQKKTYNLKAQNQTMAKYIVANPQYMETKPPLISAYHEGNLHLLAILFISFVQAT